jgi:hypothetical protein
MFGPGGGLYEMPKGVGSWPFEAKEASAIVPRMHRAAVERARKEADTKALWVLERSVPSEDAFVTLSTALYPAGACLASMRSAWALEAKDLAVKQIADERPYAEPSVAWSASMSLVHYDAALKRNELEVGKCCGEHFDGEVASDLPIAFDYDGDGEPEVILHSRILSHGADDDGLTLVKTFHAGAITSYAPLSKLEVFGPALDSDGNGRPDLRTHAGIRVAADPKKQACNGHEGARSYEPAFLVHSLADGSFSVTDDAAKRFARSWCPSPPASIESPADAGCARLWADSPEKLASEGARVKASCVELEAKDCNPGAKPAAGAVWGCGLRAEAFAKAPPFTLP